MKGKKSIGKRNQSVKTDYLQKVAYYNKGFLKDAEHFNLVSQKEKLKLKGIKDLVIDFIVKVFNQTKLIQRSP